MGPRIYIGLRVTASPRWRPALQRVTSPPWQRFTAQPRWQRAQKSHDADLPRPQAPPPGTRQAQCPAAALRLCHGCHPPNNNTPTLCPRSMRCQHGAFDLIGIPQLRKRRGSTAARAGGPRRYCRRHDLPVCSHCCERQAAALPSAAAHKKHKCSTCQCWQLLLGADRSLPLEIPPSRHESHAAAVTRAHPVLP